jgi:inosine/xanthosine triphosphatase
MPKIIVASQNPVKINAALDAFHQIFPEQTFEVSGVSVPSGVSDQPMTSAETSQGAMNRATNAHDGQSDADYWVGIEGGIHDTDVGMQCFAWVVVLGRDERIGRGQTAVFYLPIEVADIVRDGMELGHADDKVFGRSNSKQQNGAIGLLTNDAVDRTSYYIQAVIMALVPFKNLTLTW